MHFPALLAAAILLTPISSEDPANSREAFQCHQRHVACQRACVKSAGVVTYATPANSPARACSNGCEDGYFECRQAIDTEWRKGPELRLCDGKLNICRQNCTTFRKNFPHLSADEPDIKDCLPTCESGYELCRSGQGYWLNWLGKRERI